MINFVKCVRQMAHDRLLIQNPRAFFWCCAYANRQHPSELALELPEGQPLVETPFARAMQLAAGTLSVLDSNGNSWGRIWCVYELFQTLSNSARGDVGYTYDMYTCLPSPITIEYPGRISAVFEAWANSWTDGQAHLDTALQPLKCGIRSILMLAFVPVLCWSIVFSQGRIDATRFFSERGTGHRIEEREAVGITQGRAECDNNQWVHKSVREAAFPLSLLELGVSFTCQEGQASIEADKDRILATIGDGAVELNDVVHGCVAASALTQALSCQVTAK